MKAIKSCLLMFSVPNPKMGNEKSIKRRKESIKESSIGLANVRCHSSKCTFDIIKDKTESLESFSAYYHSVYVSPQFVQEIDSDWLENALRDKC